MQNLLWCLFCDLIFEEKEKQHAKEDLTCVYQTCEIFVKWAFSALQFLSHSKQSFYTDYGYCISFAK